MNKQELKILTNETLKKIRECEMVPPSVYEEVFFANARDKHIKLDNMEDANSFILEKVEKINEQAKKSTSELKKSIDEAIVAIEKKDENMLQAVNDRVTHLQDEVASLRDQLYRDELTKIYNRKWMFENFLHDDIFIKSGSIAFIDVNSFKHINDTFGHITGDQVLVLIASLLNKIPKSNAVRYAGDEFIVISSDSKMDYLNSKLQQNNDYLSNKRLKTGKKIFKVNFSFGVAKFKNGDLFKDIIEIIDKKMYDYKKAIKKK